MDNTAIPPALPLMTPQDLSFAADALNIIQAKEMDQQFSAIILSLRTWLKGNAMSEYYGLTPHCCKLAVEMCHVLYGLDKALIRCAAETEDKQLQELFILHAFHAHRMKKTWDTLCQALTHVPLSELEPLTSTLMFQLTLENIAAKDPLAFAYAIDLFGSPGYTESIDSIAAFFNELLDNPNVINTLTIWQSEALDNRTSFASIPATQTYGYPHSGSYGKACSDIIGARLQRDIDSSLINLASLGDQFHLFYRGVRVFYVEKAFPFPQRQMNWLHSA
ncbi:hypothetical protein NFB44_13980 [Yersinia ruckeri]|uniref:hypothetical protein n=1 Tax=Yersinia ruckeri TaxID=29486 RepID=UPI00223730B5|nr:hypothetical protein [Yersinia ruckeri]MCW6556483.1 hypothetical protein [Yersinia ruckeri]UZX75308.1 hypothetical protein ND012_00710 [Yersinia ruckeri]